jgi:HTH-type transcriptional regulator/antitoxin HigA
VKDEENKVQKAESPAEILRGAMKAKGWTQSDLAYVLGLRGGTGINLILSGKRGISAEMAKLLATAFDIPATSFALAQAQWELEQAPNPHPDVRARARVQAQYPLREMMKRGWIKEDAEGDKLNAQLCSFFNVSSVSEAPHISHAAKRTDTPDVPGPQLAWLFRVRQIASEMVVAPYSRDRLQDAVERMREMLIDTDEVRRVPRILHECGVRFVVVEGLPGSKIDGVCFWLDKYSPVIGMSLRFDRIDNFWFVLRHECAHVLHGHGQEVAIVDSEMEEPKQDVSVEENIADTEAGNFCVPADAMKSFYLRKNPFFSENDVLAFSKRMKVHPGVAVGQLQRIAKRYDILRKHLVKVRQSLAGSMMMDGWGDVVPVEN